MAMARIAAHHSFEIIRNRELVHHPVTIGASGINPEARHQALPRIHGSTCEEKNMSFDQDCHGRIWVAGSRQ